jgi:hypothetical protein
VCYSGACEAHSDIMKNTLSLRHLLVDFTKKGSKIGIGGFWSSMSPYRLSNTKRTRFIANVVLLLFVLSWKCPKQHIWTWSFWQRC